MTDPSIVLRKLASLRECLEVVRAWRPDDVTALRDDRQLRDAIALNVLVIVQDAMDIAFHISTDEGWGVPASYREAFEILASRGVIERSLADAMTAAVGLRNRIAHGYATLDAERLWAELPEGMLSFGAFVAAVTSFLTSHPTAQR